MVTKTARIPGSLAVLAGVTAAAVYQRGAFYNPESLFVAVVATGLICFSLISGTDRRALWVVAAVGASILSWLLAAVHDGNIRSFLPLGASMTGFLASYLVVRRFGAAQRAMAAQALVAIGTAAAGIGLTACVTRDYPWAMPSQDLWRLATTLTYSDAAGALIGLCLLVALSLDQERWPWRAAISVCLAGVVASQSRGAVLAVVFGSFLVPPAAVRRALVPLLAGLAGGLIVVGTSSGSARQPLAGLALVATTTAAALLRPPWRAHSTTLSRRWVLILSLAALVVLGGTGAALHTQIHRRIELGSASERASEWRAAFDQWASSPVTGVGPDEILRVRSKDGTYAHFAHNEYLQVLADTGLVGELLLASSLMAVACTVRREDAMSRCGGAGLVVFAVAATLDFDWHLAAIGLLGGWAAGLAAPGGDAGGQAIGPPSRAGPPVPSFGRPGPPRN